MFFNEEKFRQRAAELEGRRWAQKSSVEWFYTKEGGLGADEVYTSCPEAFEGDKIRLGEEFVGRDRYIWLQRAVAIPALEPGCKVMGYFNFGRTGGGGNSGFESLLYINGHPYQGVDTNHREVMLTPFAGQTVLMTFLVWSGLEGGGPVRLQYHRIAEAQIGCLDEKLDELYYLLSAAAESLAYLPEDSTDRTELVKALDRTLSILDWDADRLPETGKEALAFFSAALDGMPKNNAVTVYATGHTHIDVSWLWRLKHTREKAQRSFATVLRLMEEYPEYHFLQTQPQLYKFLKKDSPEIYEGIKQRVQEGRWEADGGMWLEADCNVTSGESLARQFLYGIRFIEEEFGKKCRFLWLPDVFGYSWALPQIMKLCGLDTFMTTKISWNQFNTVPNDLFRWRGIDGTEMLTYFIDVPAPGMSVTGRGSTYNGEITPETIMGTWRKFKNKELSHEVLISYGHGDGGGGTTRGMIENIRAINRIPGMPRIKTANAQEFFEKIHENVENTDRYVPLWDGELYLEYHRGTYTSQARNKRNNRKLENALGQLEWLSVLSRLAGGAYPAQRIHDCWETVLRDQFHDIIPGSSIHEVYEDTRKEYEALWREVDAMEKEAFEALYEDGDGSGHGSYRDESSRNNGSYSHNSYSLLRFADTVCREAVLIPESRDGSFTDEEGKCLPAQKVSDGWLVEAGVKPLGLTEVHFTEEKQPETDSPFALDLEGRCLDTPFYSIKWDESGAFTSLWDKENGRQVLKGRGNVLRIYEDKPMNYDAWDIDIFYGQKFEDIPACEIRCTEDGPLRMKISFVYRYRASLIEQELMVYSGNRRIDFATKADWHEDHRLLKTLFEVDIRSTKASYDIQFGFVERPTHWNTSWDWARFEVCGHKWADLSESDYGVSLLNDCKYGYGIRDNVMGLSLLKSAKSPDTEADMGEHFFTYALLPHKGSLGKETVTQGILLNQPALCVPGAVKKQAGQFLKKNCGTVLIDAVKLAEDGDGYVVHMHECAGGRAHVELTSDYSVKAYAACNLLEEYEEKTDGSAICADFGPFEIKCFRIWM